MKDSAIVFAESMSSRFSEPATTNLSCMKAIRAMSRELKNRRA
jgi:hypothetical protein